MKRTYESYLEEWYNRVNRKPLILRGARQVGKTTLVRQFAENQGLDLLELNFEEDHALHEIFSSPDVKSVIQTLELVHDLKITTNTLLFLDEIQAAPQVISLLRYFFERLPEIPVIAAGSLLEFALEEFTHAVPVGRVEFCYMGPLSFEEFLSAMGRHQLLAFLQQYKLSDGPIPEAVHLKAMEYLRTYMLLGGMPQVIQTYLAENSLKEADAVKYSIIQTFREDFHKYHGKVAIKMIQEVFERLGGAVGKKIVYTSLLPGEKTERTKRILTMMTQAQVFSPVYHSSANGIPLAAEMNRKRAKGLLLDIGLLQALNGLSLAALRINEDLLFSNQGVLAEQFIGQHLLMLQPPYIRPQLYYWAREKARSSAELDYIIQTGNTLLPIEVKSGPTGRLRSLHLFMEQKRLEAAVRFSTHTPIIEQVSSSLPGSDYRYTLYTLPLYLVEEVERLVFPAGFSSQPR